ncbi:MAG: GNAT family N-acetyltransferase [Acidimicrobiales bacterium]
MSIDVWRSDDAAAVLGRAGAYLRSQPVLHNLILTLLQSRADRPEPGRYWVVEDDGSPVGLVFQSPLDFAATITPMSRGAIDAAVAAVVGDSVDLPGVNGDAGTAARFAGQWTEARGTAAAPERGMRLYELGDLHRPAATPGSARRARPEDADVVVEMFEGFHTDTGETGTVPAPVWAESRIASDLVWLWDDGEPCALAAVVPTVEGVARIQTVYTPPGHRRKGRAANLVAHVSDVLLGEGARVVLFTDLGHPTSNSVYRRIGFRAVGENLRYVFEG